MQICRVTRSFPPATGGLELHAELLSRYQARRGDQVWVLQPQQEGVLEPGATLCRVPLGPLRPWIYRGRTPAKIATSVFAARAATLASRLYRRHLFDLIHLHGDALEAFFLAAFTRSMRVSRIVTLHSGLNRQRRYRQLAARVFRSVDGFIAVSPVIRDQVQELGVEPDRIAVISSGVNLLEFRPPSSQDRMAARAGLALCDGELLILSVGRLHAKKGYGDLMEAVVGLATPQRVRVAIVGDGPERETLQRRAQDVQSVSLVGAIDHGDVIRYLHAADIFVVPSIDLSGDGEGTPTALLEAMACRLPVVCTDAGGLGQLIRDGENGLVVSQRDPTNLRIALQRLLAQPRLRARFGERNAALAPARDWSAVATQVSVFCDRVCKDRKR